MDILWGILGLILWAVSSLGLTHWLLLPPYLPFFGKRSPAPGDP